MANSGYIQVTRLCNQECRFCSNPLREETITLSRAKKYIDIYKKKGYAHVLLTGGEPTLHPELGKMISYCRDNDMQCQAITNGQLTSDPQYLESLIKCGLTHMTVSLHSHQDKLQAFLSKNKRSLSNIKKTLANAKRFKIRVDIITVINKYNSGHLSEIVKWLNKEFGFIRHFIWNNIDPHMNRASKNLDTIPALNDFELELSKAVHFLEDNGKTFRVERVPLCYMPEFEHVSTETRKIIKDEERAILFLDDNGYVVQKGQRSLSGYSKAGCCCVCSLTDICAGLFAAGKYYSLQELHPVFIAKEEIIRKVLGNG